MEHESRCVRSTTRVPERIRQALTVLFEAADYAAQTSCSPWDFAVEISTLDGLRLSFNDYRWLVRKGFVDHRREVTLEGDDGRAFRRSGDLSFCNRTCFVLTELGKTLAWELCGEGKSDPVPIQVDSDASRKDDRATNGTPIPSSNGSPHGPEASLPKWDSERRVLTLSGKTVKHFKWIAENQETILSAFEEEGWPPRIDDPLPPRPDQDSKRRLSDTIKCLNRKQSNLLIHFRGDGTGEGVIWDFVEHSS